MLRGKKVRKMKNYIFKILVALDQLLNAVLGGWADETLSSRAYRAHRDKKFWGWLKYPINWLFWWQTDHCLEAYKYEVARHQLPPEMRL